MRRRSLAAVCACAALAAVGYASATASAEPEFLTKAVVGETATSSVPFTGTVGALFFEGAISKAKITCTGGTLEGEVTGAKSVGSTVIRLTGCETSGCKVHSEGQPEGVLLSEVLAGKLGGVTSSLPGIKLFSQSEGKGGVLLRAGIGGCPVSIEWKGEVTGSLSGGSGSGPETGKLVSSLKLTFAEKNGVQKYQGFSEGPEEGLMGQLTARVNGSEELNGLSGIGTLKPAPVGLGVTK